MDSNTNEPSRFDLLELDSPPRTPAAAPAPEQRPSLPLSPAAARLAERANAPVTDRYYSREEVRREYQSRGPAPAARVAPQVDQEWWAAQPDDPASRAARAQQPRLGQQILAGARREATGVLMSWAGRGSMTRAQVVECLRAASLSEAWAPAALSAHAVIGRRLSALNGEGRIVRAVRKGKSSRASWKARWVVGVVNPAALDVVADVVGTDDHFGHLVLTVDLMPSYAEGEVNMRITGDANLEAALRRDVAADLLAETLSSADVTAWLQRVLREHFAGVPMGNVTYLPTYERRNDLAEALCGALRAAGWGESWMLPAIPVATSEQLQAGLVEALKAELIAVYDEVMAQKGTRGLTRAQAQVETVAERARVLQAHVGDEGLAKVLAGVKAMREAISAIQCDVSQRAALLELE